MATNMFLYLNGIQGESKDAKHAKEIDVLAWSWGASQSGNMQLGAGGGSGKTAVEDLSFTHYIDCATHDLWQRVFNGKHVKEGTLTVRKASELALDYFIIKMTDILVTSIHAAGSVGEERLTENVTLNFSKVEIVYIPQKGDGSADSAKMAGWDFRNNVSAV